MLENCMQTTRNDMKNEPKKGATSVKNPEKWPPKIDAEKNGYNAAVRTHAVSPRTPTIQQDAPQEIYKSK